MDINHKLQLRAQSAELWLLRLQRASRLPAPLFGVVAGALVFVAVTTPIVAGYGVEAAMSEWLSGAMFFAVTIGVVAGFSAPVYRGAVEDLDALAPVLTLDDRERGLVRKSLVRESTGRTLSMAGLGLICGLLHCWFMGTQRMPPAYAVAQASGTLLIWTTMWTTLGPLINNATIFASLGTQAHPDLLRPSRHAAFGRAALRPALFVIGILCAYPIIAVRGGLSGATLVAFGVTLSILFGLFLLPLTGIRRRIREVRAEMLTALDQRIDSLHRRDMAAADAQHLFELDAVLDIRERVARASAWPLDLAGIKRITLYVVLPPLTWAAAALVEMAIDQLV